MVRIVSYNIRKCVGLDWRRRPDRVIEVLRELRADIVALQEADQRFGDRAPTLPIETLTDHTGLALVPTGQSRRSSGHHGNAVLISKHASVVGTTTLDLPSLEPRGAMIAEISLGGMMLTIVAVHLGLRPSDRLRQVKTILATIAKSRNPRRTIILGDMNAWSTTGPAMRALAVDFQPSQALKTFHSAMPVAPLDRIFLGRDFRFGKTFVHRSANADIASDHLPVCADIALNHASQAATALPPEREAVSSNT